MLLKLKYKKFEKKLSIDVNFLQLPFPDNSQSSDTVNVSLEKLFWESKTPL